MQLLLLRVVVEILTADITEVQQTARCVHVRKITGSSSQRLAQWNTSCCLQADTWWDTRRCFQKTFGFCCYIIFQCVSILRWCHSGLRGGHYGPQPSVDQLNQYWVCSGWLVSLVNSSDCNLLQRELVETVTNVKTPQRQTCWHAAVTFDLRDTSSSVLL